MIFFQVEDILQRFEDLKRMEERSWQDLEHENTCGQQENENPRVPHKTRPEKKLKGAKKKPSAQASSGLKSLMAAKRKEMKMQTDDKVSTPRVKAVAEEERVFEGGFFSVRSPLRSSNSEARRTTRASAKLSLA